MKEYTVTSNKVAIYKPNENDKKVLDEDNTVSLWIKYVIHKIFP